jgi:membrane protease YdiL (CAAX protease family)
MVRLVVRPVRASRASALEKCHHAPVSNDATPASPPPPLFAIARGVAFLVGIATALRVADLFIGRSPLGSALVGAVIVFLAVDRAGVRWEEEEAETGSPYRRALRGLGAGGLVALGILAVTVVLGLILGRAHLALGVPSTSLVFGLLRAGAVGVRDELLYRGIPLVSVAQAGLPAPYALVYAALAGGFAQALVAGSSPEGLVLVTAMGLLFAVLWRRAGAAWPAVGAHAAWSLLAGPALRGGLLDVTWKDGLLADGARTYGAPAWIAAALCVVAALVLLRLGATSDSLPAASPRSTP